MPRDIFFFIREEAYGFLSNFYRATQMVDGVIYDCNERYYQCEKAATPEVKQWIFQAPSPFLAMVAGHGLRVGKEAREGWNDEMRLNTMLKGLRAKFAQNPDLGDMLLATGESILHENNPDDPFWGYVKSPCDTCFQAENEWVPCYKGSCKSYQEFLKARREGDNLGKLLMKVRKELSNLRDAAGGLQSIE